MESALHNLLADNHRSLLQAVGAAGAATTASLTARLASQYDVITAALPQVCQLSLGGVPLPVRADDNIGGTTSAVRHRWLAITNGAATMAIGWGLNNPIAGAQRTMLNSFLVLPNSSMVIPDTQAFRSGSSSISLAGLYAFCASASSGARACFMWHQLPVNSL